MCAESEVTDIPSGQACGGAVDLVLAQLIRRPLPNGTWFGLRTRNRPRHIEASLRIARRGRSTARPAPAHRARAAGSRLGRTNFGESALEGARPL